MSCFTFSLSDSDMDEARTLINGCCLRLLSMNDNHIGDKGCQTLFSFLHDIPSLTELYVGNNGITEDSIDSLTDLVRIAFCSPFIIGSNTKLQVVDITGEPLSESAEARLVSKSISNCAIHFSRFTKTYYLCFVVMCSMDVENANLQESAMDVELPCDQYDIAEDDPNGPVKQCSIPQYCLLCLEAICHRMKELDAFGLCRAFTVVRWTSRSPTPAASNPSRWLVGKEMCIEI